MKPTGVMNEPQPEAQVMLMLRRTDEAIEALQNAVGELVGRLGPVMVPEAPKNAISGTPPHPDLCPIAETMRAHTDTVFQVRGVIGSVLDRLQV
jgi:hypothetical protein